MKKFNHLSEKEKVELSVCKREGWSNRKIAKQLKRSKLTIRYYLKNLNNSKFKKTRERKKKLTKRDVRNIVRTASQQGISSTTIKKSMDLPVLASTIRRVLKDSESLQYSKRKPASDLKTAHTVSEITLDAPYFLHFFPLLKIFIKK